MTNRHFTLLAWGLASFAIACALAGAVFLALNGREQIVGYSVSGIGLGIAFPAIGAFIASRRPTNPIGWIFCAIGLSQGVDVFVTQYAEYGLAPGADALFGADVAAWLAGWTFTPGFGLLLTLSILLFPSGRLPSRRWLPVAYLSGVGIALMAVPTAIAAWSHRGPALMREDLGEISQGLEAAQQVQGVGFVLVLVCAVVCIVGLIGRFRRSNGEERAQLKWFTYAGTVVVTVLAITPFVKLPQALDATTALVLAPLLPIATAAAILKYRLYDIDRLINRTLVYTALTAILLGGYAGGVLLIQALLPLPEDSPAAVAVSTLAMAALIRPLRARIQEGVDRRFNRAQYDARHTVDEFGMRLRMETDLDSLASDLRGVVGRTLQPDHVSLWFREPGAPTS